MVESFSLNFLCEKNVIYFCLWKNEEKRHLLNMLCIASFHKYFAEIETLPLQSDTHFTLSEDQLWLYL